MFERTIPCRTGPLIFLRQDEQLWRVDGPSDGEAVVGGAIVNDDYFFVRPRLVKGRRNRIGDQGFCVV